VLLKQVTHQKVLLCKGHTSAAEVQLHTFLTWALDVGQWLTSCPGHFNPITQWRRGRMSPRNGLDILKKRNISAPNRIRTPHCLDCSLVTIPIMLLWPSYCDPWEIKMTMKWKTSMCNLNKINYMQDFRLLTERNGRSSWEWLGIVEFCTCQRNEWISGFCHSAVDVFSLLGCYMAHVDSWLLTFGTIYCSHLQG
jgi:hypothetical protein